MKIIGLIGLLASLAFLASCAQQQPAPPSRAAQSSVPIASAPASPDDLTGSWDFVTSRSNSTEGGVSTTITFHSPASIRQTGTAVNGTIFDDVLTGTSDGSKVSISEKNTSGAVAVVFRGTIIDASHIQGNAVFPIAGAAGTWTAERTTNADINPR